MLPACGYSPAQTPRRTSGGRAEIESRQRNSSWLHNAESRFTRQLPDFLRQLVRFLRQLPAYFLQPARAYRARYAAENPLNCRTERVGGGGCKHTREQVQPLTALELPYYSEPWDDDRQRVPDSRRHVPDRLPERPDACRQFDSSDSRPAYRPGIESDHRGLVFQLGPLAQAGRPRDGVPLALGADGCEAIAMVCRHRSANRRVRAPGGTVRSARAWSRRAAENVLPPAR